MSFDHCTSCCCVSSPCSSEFPFPTMAPTPAPPRTKHKLVVEGKKLTFRCGKKIASKKGKVQWVPLSLICYRFTWLQWWWWWWCRWASDSSFSWYKDGELLEFSHPNYISLKDDHLTIIANAINEGTYTCIVKKKNKILTNYSWRVRVRFWRTPPNPSAHWTGHIHIGGHQETSLTRAHTSIIIFL